MPRLVQLAVISTIALATDIANVARFGRNAPRFAERLWVDPAALTPPPDPPHWRLTAGRGTGGEGDLDTWRIDESVVQACILRWRDGLPWKDTGAYDHIMAAM